MKRIYFVGMCGLVLAAFAYSQAPIRKPPIKVTTQALVRQPATKPYVIDLTRNGQTYAVSADVASRVRIRTQKGTTAITDLLKKLKVTSDKFVVGRLADFLPPHFTGRPGSRMSSTTTAFNCDGDVCTCNPIAPNDCWQMGFDCDAPMVCVNPCEGPECAPEQANRLLYCWCEQWKPE
jgi:hypothetical protein